MKKIKGKKKILVTLSMMLVMAGAFTTKVEAKLNKIKVTAPSGKTVRVAKGKKVKLKTTVKKLKNKNVKFKSNNPKIARVTAKGIVKGLENGKTKIVVSSKSNPKIKKIIKVVVYKKAVKKIKLNKTKVGLTSGQQFKLVAKISPKKNVSKVLSYKSSNKKVVTVSKKGIIKAVVAGTAKIKVMSTDGSKKKATCKVRVKEVPVEIKSVKVESAFSLEVELDKAKALSYEDFTILCKQPDDKEYKDIFDITSLNTMDNIHYEVLVNNLGEVKEKDIYVDKIYCRNFLGANHTKNYLEGINSRSVDLFDEVGQQFSYKEYFDEFITAEIKKITVSELPKGLTAAYAEDNSYVEIKGTFAEKTYEYKTVISAIDIYDKEYLVNYYFYIGDEDTLYVKARECKTLTYIPGERKMNDRDILYIPYIDFSENGYYTNKCEYYKAEGLPNNTYINDFGYICLKDASKPVKAGEYNITLSATTPTGKNFTTKYKLTLVDGILVKGRLTDPAGKSYGNEIINFRSKIDDVNLYYYEAEAKTDENGNYQIRLIPGIYDVYSNNKNIYNSYCVDFTKDTTLNIKSLYYKILFVNPILDIVVDFSNIRYFDYDDNRVYDTKGRANMVISSYERQNDDKFKFILLTYLKKGTYNFGEGLLNFNGFKEPERYKVLTKQFTISESGEVKIDLEKVENN